MGCEAATGLRRGGNGAEAATGLTSDKLWRAEAAVLVSGWGSAGTVRPVASREGGGAVCGEKDGDVARVGERGCGAGRRTERLTGVTGLLRRIQGEEDGMHGMQQGWGGGLRDAGREAPLHTVLHCGRVNGAERGCCTGMRTGLLRRPDWECWVGN